MPTHVQDLLVEVDLVCISLLPHPSTLASRAVRGRAARSRASLLRAIRGCGIDGSWNADFLCLECRFVCLQDDFRLSLGIRGVDHEVVVVAACHDIAWRRRTEDDLEFVEDAVVLVGVAESGAEVLVNGNGLDWLTLHIDVPDLDGQVVAGEDVAAVMS